MSEEKVTKENSAVETKCSTEDSSGNENLYYRLCLRHMGKNDNCFLLWGENASGYQRNIEDAGFYNPEESTKNDPVVSKEIVDKFKKLIRLPSYGDYQETYAGKNEFHVLPNTGQVRKALGLTVLNIHLEGDRNSFNAYFKDECIEVFKNKFADGQFHVKGKTRFFDEHWYYDEVFEAKNRNQAAAKAFKAWERSFQGHYQRDSFIEFKSMVVVKKHKEVVFDKWRKIK